MNFGDFDNNYRLQNFEKMRTSKFWKNENFMLGKRYTWTPPYKSWGFKNFLQNLGDESQFWWILEILIIIIDFKILKKSCNVCAPILGLILENFDSKILVLSQSYNTPPWRNFDFLSNSDEIENLKFDEIGNFGELRNLGFDKIWKFGIVQQNLIINLDRSQSQLSKNTKITKFGQILVHQIQNSYITNFVGSKKNIHRSVVIRHEKKKVSKKI